MNLDSSTLAMISSFMEVAFILLFVFAVIGLLISARIGYKRGIYKSTYKLFGLALFIILAVVTLKPFINFAMNFDLSSFFSEPLKFDLEIGTTTISVEENVTTVEATLDGVCRSFLSQINAESHLSDVTSAVKTLVFSIVSLVIFIVDLILIFGFGGLILDLFWVLFFKRLTPKITQKLGKIRFIGMAETIVTYVVTLFLIMSPFTSIINSINQGIQKSNARDSENETVQDVIHLVDIYNDSIFAKTFFNWNADLNDSHLTFDTYMIDMFAQIANGGESDISFSEDIINVIGAVGNVIAGLGENNENGYPTLKLSGDVVGGIFDIFEECNYFGELIEVATAVALDSDLLPMVLPNAEYYSKIDLEGITFKEEMQTLENMARDIADSGIIEDFIDLNTYELKSTFEDTPSMIEYIDDLFSSEDNRYKVDKIFNIFNRLDEFKLLDNSIQSLGFWGVTNDSEYTFLKLLGGNVECDKPYDDENNKALICNFLDGLHIGEEVHTLLDSLWGLASCGDHVIKNAYYSFASMPADFESKEEKKTAFETKKLQAKKDLVNTLSANDTLEKFRDCITGAGHMNEDGSPKVRDALKGEHSALLDSGLIARLINSSNFAKEVFNKFALSEKIGESGDTAKTNWDSLMADVYSDSNDYQPIKFFKTEIDSILKVVTNIAALKNPSLTSNPASAVLKAAFRYNAADGNGEEPETPFEYKDYDTLLEAIVNLFDGWVNKDDIVGSIFSIESRIAPYLSEMFKCLKPLDESKIVYAIGIPILTSKMATLKENSSLFFDVDICIQQIENNESLFADISNFLNTKNINNLQHLITGLLMDDEGHFNLDNIGEDPMSFLEKFNQNIEIIHDDPSTSANESVLDSHPLKYYFAETLKAFYNFEIFNPKTGPNANKNMRNLFNFLFEKLESFNIEKPSDEIYDQLDAPGKWEDELTAITELFAVIGKNRLLNIKNFSSNIDSALLYSLAGDMEKAKACPTYDSSMPTNLGEVLSCVGDSLLFSNMMGGLLDGYLEGTLCDAEIGVQFNNISSCEYWHQEGENMNSLLTSIARLDLDLKNLDFTKITDVVGMNEMLHSLSDSLIFKDGDTNRFGEWLYSKAGDSLNSMSNGLLEDPSSDIWKTEWDSVVNSVENTKYPTQKIAYHDFVVRDGALPNDYNSNKAGWSCNDFESKMNSFKAAKNYDSLSNEEINELYKSDEFMKDYFDDVLQYDEIGRLVNVLSNGIKLMNGGSGSIDFASLNSNDLDNMLTALNNSDSLRICTYNAMNLAKDGIGTNEFVDINQARFEFLVDANAGLDNYTLGRENRQIEIDHIVKFYDYYEQLKDITGDSLDSSVFFEKAKLQEILGVDENGNNDPTKVDILTNMMSELEQTYCFNLLTLNDRKGSELSLFESMIVSLMEKSGLKGLADIPEEDHTTMEERVVKISNHEVDGSINPDGYNSSWVVLDGSGEVVDGECVSITGVLKSVVGASDGDTIDADELSITAIKASKIGKVMTSVNASYLCTGVMKHFVREAFTGGMSLEPLLKYNPTDTDMVANFDLTYLEYGGENNACGEGTEIYALQTVLEGMQYEVAEDEYAFVTLTNLKAALEKKPDCFDGIFYFLYNSKILEEKYVGNENIKGRDVLLYNALENFNSYLIGSDKENKMLAIERIYEVSYAENPECYKVEANGISRMIDAAGNSITDISIDNLRNDSSKKETILNVVKYSYDRDDGNTAFTTDTAVTKGRAYFASEIVSGIFDDVLESEYSTIASNYTNAELSAIDDYQIFYFASKDGGGRATTAADITATTFDNINEVELNGLDGMISMTKYVNGEANRTGLTLATIADNAFIKGMIENQDEIKSLFATKLHSNDQDSRMGKILFVSRGAKTISKETTLANDTIALNSGLFVILKFANNYPTLSPSECVWTTGFTNDFYSEEFSFADYGEALIDYINGCSTTI